MAKKIINYGKSLEFVFQLQEKSIEPTSPGSPDGVFENRPLADQDADSFGTMTDPTPIEHHDQNMLLSSATVTPTSPVFRATVIPTRRASRVASAMILHHTGSMRSAILERQETSSSLLSAVAPLVPWSKSREAKASLLSVVSALYALILAIIAFAFEISVFINEGSSSSDYDGFFVFLYIIGLLFLAYCYMYLLRNRGWRIPVPFYRSTNASMRNLLRPKTAYQQQHHTATKTATHLSSSSTKHRVTYSANTNTGSMYLRLGATFFGIMGIVDKATNVYVALDGGSFGNCYRFINVSEDVLGAIFIFVQLYFIFENSKITIHKFPEIGHFGTMHLIATNLCIWMRAILAEEYHMMIDIQGNGQHDKKTLLSIGPPFSLYDSITSVHGHVLSTPSASKDTNCTDQTERLSSAWHLKPFLTTCLIEYTVICAAVMYVLWKNTGTKRAIVDKFSKLRKRSVHIDCSSSTKGLFIGLAFVAFTLISMVSFFTKVQKNQYHQALFICHLSDSTLYMAAILAISLAMYRMRNLNYVNTNHKGLLLDNILLIVGLVSQLLMCVFAMAALSRIDLTSGMVVVVSLLRMIEVLLQTIFIFYAQRLCSVSTSSTDPHGNAKPGRELVTFLLMMNLAMFLINTFETQKSGSNPVTIEFYGKAVWTVIVYSTVPLNTFYRFHSSVCLAEIWKTTYRTKYTEAMV